MNRSCLRFVLLLTAVAPLEGCLPYHLKIAGYRVPPPSPVGRFIAGVGQVEITPPPGYPLAGHSIAAGVARGYWTRLYARAFYLRDASGREVVLVSVDLFGVSAGLRAGIMQKLASKGLALPEQGFVLAATHTHHGPGNFLSSKLYNSFASPIPGFDENLFNFLVRQISTSVLMAKENAEANAADEHGLILHSGRACGMLRNRANSAYGFDPPAERAEIEQASRQCAPFDQELANCSGDGCRRFVAVDPSLYVIEIVRRRGAQQSRAGVLVFLAVHNTAMSHDNPLYTADHAGYAMAKLQSDLGPNVVAGFFNGAEGDVSPRWIRQDRRDVLRIGSLFHDAVQRALQKTADRSDFSPDLISGFVEIPGKHDDLSAPGMGVADLGGAEDGRTFLYHYGWHGGVISDSDEGLQGDKQPGLDHPTYPDIHNLKVSNLVESPGDFPKTLPVMVVRLGSVFSIGTIPVEMTTAMGWRVRKSLSQLEAPRVVALIGLANEYVSYVTTPEEFEAQAYEGASNAFGKMTGIVLKQALESLSKQLSNGTANQVSEIRPKNYNVGPKEDSSFWGDLGPGRFRNEHILNDEGLESLIPDDSRLSSPRTPRFDWTESTSSQGLTFGNNFQSRRVVVLRVPNGSLFDSEQSGDIMTLTTGKGDLTVKIQESVSPDVINWRAIWVPPDTIGQNDQMQFEVTTADGKVCRSVAFVVSEDSASSPVALQSCERRSGAN